MSSLTPDTSKRRDFRRKRKSEPDGVAAGVESEGEDVGEDHQKSLQPRASLHSKRSPKVPKASGSPFIEINGDFNFKGHLTFGELRDSHQRASLAQSTRGSTRAAQANKARRSATHRDAPIDPQTETGDESSSYSDESSSSIVPSTRPAKSIIQPPREPRRSSNPHSKRSQPDEGYQTGRSASYTGKGSKESDKGIHNRRQPSPGGSSSRHARLSSSVKSRRSRAAELEISEANSEADRVEGSEVSTENEAVEDADEDNKEAEQDEDDDNDVDDDDESDDDWGKLFIQISGADSQALDEKAILDTGTKPNWISQIFYEKLRKIGIKAAKLTPDEKKREYSDFNSKKFSPESKVKLLIQSDEFQGIVKSRVLTFFISRKSSFSILIGMDTIKHEEFLSRRKRDTDGEGVLVGQHGEVSEAEKAETKRKRDERNRIADERKKKREEKREEKMEEKGNDRTTSSNKGGAVHLATLVTRGGRPPLPPTKGASGVAKVSKKPSDSSLEGTW